MDDTETREKTREKIISAVKRTPSITIKDLSLLTNLSIKGVEWQIAKLKSNGTLRRIGSDRSGYWEIVEK